MADDYLDPHEGQASTQCAADAACSRSAPGGSAASLDEFFAGDALLAGISEARQAPELARVLRHLPRLHSIASELFLDDVSIGVDSDPEVENHRQLVFHVSTVGTPRDAADRLLEWFQRTTPLLGEDCDKVHLSISLIQHDRP